MDIPWLFVVFCSVFITGAGCLHNGFVGLDDQIYLENPSAIKGLTVDGIRFAFSTVATEYWHPLAWVSHELDIQLYRNQPFGHYLTSLSLFAITAALLFSVLRKLGAGGVSAGIGTLTWALHPLRVESFAWVAERKDVLFTLFVVVTLRAY